VNLFLGDEHLTRCLLAAGWVKVQIKEGKEDEKLVGERAEYHNIQKEAEAAGRGVHNTGVNPLLAVRVIDWNPDHEFYNHYRNKAIDAVVEKAIDGSTLRAEVYGLPGADPLQHVVVNLRLAGVEAPPTPLPPGVVQQQNEQKGKGDSKVKAEKPQPFALEAQSFVEQRLLNRDVKIVLQGFDKSGNFFGSVLYPKGNISERLLQEGYAKTVKWSLNLLPSADAERLRKAEQAAQERHLRRWTEKELKNAKNAITQEFQGRVVLASSGERLSIVPEGSDQEQKFSLASIRAPRLGARGQPDEPYAFEAREYLRKKLVGKVVRVVVEYSRDPLPEAPTQEVQVFASIYLNKENIAEGLVAEGLATVVRHRPSEDRATAYDQLLLAENNAMKAAVGVHNPVPPPSSTATDLTRSRGRGDEDSDVKAKVGTRRLFEAVVKEKSHQGIVEYVFSSSRFKVRIPRHNVIVAVFLSGVQTPSAKEETADSPAARALELAKSKLLQRNVRIEVEGSDKYDNLIANVFLGKENFAITLLTDGLARLVGPPDRNKYYQEMKTTEDQAKAARHGLWKDYVEGQELPEGEDDAADLEEDDEKSGNVTVGVGKEILIRVTDITDASNFFCQFVKDARIETVSNAMKSFVDDPTGEFTAESLPKAGTNVAGRFSDGEWYRVRIEGKTAQPNQYRCYFVDYGNREILEISALRALDEEVAKIPPLAHPCVLSALKGPGELSDYYELAGRAFSSLVWDKEITAHVDLVDAGRLYVTLKDPADPSESINSKLLRAGWARVQQRRVPFRLQKMAEETLRPLEAEAKQAHRGVWEYGGISDDEETAADDGGRVPLRRNQGRGAPPKKGEAKKEEKGKEKVPTPTPKGKETPKEVSKKEDDKGKEKAKGGGKK
jgi:staphylococcal nuclease domain-containing protein 1